MGSIFSARDRHDVFKYIVSSAKECDTIAALVQVGSGAVGYNDDRSDLDFVIALDKDDSMAVTMEHMHRKISGRYDLVYFSQSESIHLQSYVLSDMLEIDIGYGCYEHAAARKPAFRVLYDRTGTVEDKMIRSREWMDDRIYGEKQKKDIALASSSAWLRLMHAAVAIHRGNTFRAIGEMGAVRQQYIDLLGDRYRVESDRYREIDRLPEAEKAAIKSTFVTGESSAELWNGLLALTRLIYKELEGHSVPVTEDMLYEYYKDLR